MDDMPSASALADRVRELEQRVERLEGKPARPRAASAPPRRPVEPVAPAPPTRAWQPDGTALLAVAGGLILLAGGVFLVTLAVGAGWVTPHVQVLAALAGGAAIALAGLRLHSAGASRTAARARLLAQVLVGVGCGLADLGIVAATRLYDERVLEISPPLALACGALVAAAAGALAIHWRAQALAAFALGTAILAPLAVDARPEAPVTLALVAIALAAAGAVAVARGWPWLPQFAMWISASEVATWIATNTDDGRQMSAWQVAAIAGGWWALCAFGVLGHDLRNPRSGLRLSSAIGAASAAGLATLAVSSGLGDRAAFGVDAWLLCFGALHVVLGAALAARRPQQPAFGIWIVTIAGALLAGGLAERVHGVPLVAAWLAEAVALVWFGASSRDRRAFAAAMGLGSLAGAVALSHEASPRALMYGAEHPMAAASSIVAVALALLAARALLRREPQARAVLGLAAAASLLYLASTLLVTWLTGSARIGIDGTPLIDQGAQLGLSALWVGVGLALLALGLRHRDDASRYAGFAVCALGAAKVSLFDIGALEAGYRVLAFVIAGGVLLTGAYVVHRIDARADEVTA